MTVTTLEADLRLLDLLDSLPETPQQPPSPADLARHLTALCQEQRVSASPAQVHQAVEAYLAQQALERQLLDLIQAGPSEPVDPAALRQRLAQRCQEARVPATPASIARAIATYKTRSAPFKLWTRPATEAERLAALEEYKQHHDDWHPFDTALFVIGLGSFFMGGIALLISMMFFPKEVGLVAGVSAGGIFGSLLLGVMHTTLRDGPYLPQASDRHARLINARPSARVTVKDLARLEAVPPNLDRMQAWLGNPRAAAALKLLSRTEVPITQQDAGYLDAYVHEAQQRQAKQAAVEAKQAWDQGLAQLRN